MTVVGPGVGAGYKGYLPSPFRPTLISDCILWLRSDLGITLNGSNVSGWSDQSGQGNDVAQATPANQPAYVEPAGAPYLDFNGALNHYLEGPGVNTLIASTAFSLFAVSEASNVGGQLGVIGAQSGAPRLYGYADSGSYVDFANISWTANTSLAVRHWLHDGTNFKYREDGVQLDTVAIALSALTGAKFTVGWTGGQYLTGEMYEAIIYDRALTSAEIEVVENYLMRRYGL